MDQIMDTLGPIIDTIKGLLENIDFETIISTVKDIFGSIIGG